MKDEPLDKNVISCKAREQLCLDYACILLQEAMERLADACQYCEIEDCDTYKDAILDILVVKDSMFCLSFNLANGKYYEPRTFLKPRAREILQEEILPLYLQEAKARKRRRTHNTHSRRECG